MGIFPPVLVATAEVEVVVAFVEVLEALVEVEVVVARVEVDVAVVDAFVEVDVAEVVALVATTAPVLIATLYLETERTASEPMRPNISNLILNLHQEKYQ